MLDEFESALSKKHHKSAMSRNSMADRRRSVPVPPTLQQPDFMSVIPRRQYGVSFAQVISPKQPGEFLQ
jgi:hypothetical protein